MHWGLKEDGRGWRGNGDIEIEDPVGGWESREKHIAIVTDNLLLCIQSCFHVFIYTNLPISTLKISTHHCKKIFFFFFFFSVKQKASCHLLLQ